MTDIEVFGQQLLDARDLDPVYDVLYLNRDKISTAQLKRLLLAYWCCYNLGEAAWISERTDGEFWRAMLTMAENRLTPPVGTRWPRGRERRHFRGDKAVRAVEQLSIMFPEPERSFDGFYQCDTMSDVERVVTKWPMFGPWIAFKVADMLERVAGIPVDFSEAEVFVFKDPRIAAERWYGAAVPEAIPASVKHLQKFLGEKLAPPSFNRILNLQEYETILCKWKSHENGRYPIGIDTRELHEALIPWSQASATALKLRSELENIHNGFHRGNEHAS